MIDSIVLNSGGCYGIAFIGVIKALNNAGILKNVNTFHGSSVGAIFALLLVLDYKPEEIQDVLMNMDFEKVFSFSAFNLLKKGYYGNEEYLMKYIKTAIKMKYDENITFQELFEITGKTLVINTTCICSNKPVYFSHTTHPDTQVILAVQMSLSIPFVFPFVEYKEKLYADGGICQLPIHIYDEKTHLIFKFKSDKTILNRKDKFYEVKQIIQTIGQFVYDKTNIIYIPINGIHSLSCPTEEQKYEMIKSGLLVTYEYIKEHL